ncbi:MAG: hypothetical protein ABIP75_10355 [Pyrinomonadaceae bacterium]
MKHSRVSLSAVLFLAASIAVQAQTGKDDAKAEPKPTPAPAAKTAKNTEPDRAAAQRRALAISLLLNLATEARAFKDQSLRARAQARVADALWATDAEQARALFRRAWEAAEVADQESQRKMKEEMARQQKETGGFAMQFPPRLRDEVLRLAAKRDRKLGEELLAKLKLAQDQEKNDTDLGAGSPFNENTEAARRLSLAGELLESGDTERALQFADPVLGLVNIQTLNFLSILRDHDAGAADQRYAALLMTAEGAPDSDANTVSYLTSYLFTPHLFVTIDRQGGVNSSAMGRNTKAANVAPELRQAYFRTAAAIFSRPQLQPEQDRTTCGLVGKYLQIKRLLPLFDQFAAPELTELVRTHQASLEASVNDDIRGRDDEWMRRGIRPEQDQQDAEKATQDKIDRAKTAEERDLLYLELATRALSRDDIRARDFADKISDSDLRKNTRAYVDAELVSKFVQKKKSDEALAIMRSAELTQIQRAWANAQLAKLLYKGDHDRATALLDEAIAAARRIDGSDANRPRAFFAVANAYQATSHEQTWETMSDAIRAANGAVEFTGEDGSLMFSLRAKSFASINTESVDDFDVTGIFGLLAVEDYYRSVELARGFEGEAPRSSAIIAIARAVLTPKAKPVSAK